MASHAERPRYAQLLVSARKASGLSVADIAARLRIGESTYRNAENGRGTPGMFKELELVFPTESLAIGRAWHESRASEQDGHDRFSPEDVLIPMDLLQGLAKARLTRFYPSRKYYKLLRDGRASISEYVSSAQHTLDMVSINLATGMDLEGLLETFEEMLQRHPPVTVRLSLLDPDLDYLAMAIAPVVGSSPETLRGRVRDTIAALRDFHQHRLSTSRRKCLEVWCHNCVPNASAIIIDGDEPGGLVQLETKGYKTGMDKSFGFEVAAPSDFFTTLRDSYRRLIEEGRQVL